jgi:hypothetical protein
MKGAICRFLAALALALLPLCAAAEQFLALCQSSVYKRRLFNVGKTPTRAEIRKDVETAVATFMAAFEALPSPLRGEDAKP